MLERIQINQLANPISPSLVCPICQEIFLDPTITSICFHSFCKACIQKAIEFEPQCPLCRKKLKIEDVHLNLALQALIAELMVYCPFKKNGCDEIMRYEAIENHIKSTCLYIEKKCAYERYGCDFIGLQTTLQAHLEQCSYHHLRSFLKNTNQRLEYLENLVLVQQRMIASLLESKRIEVTQIVKSPISSPGRSDVDSSCSQDLEIAHHNWIENGMRCVKTITTERSGVTSLAYRNDALYSGAYDGSIKIFDFYSNNLRKTLTGHRLSVWSIAIDENEQRLFTGSSDEVIKVWSVSSSDNLSNDEQPLASFGANHGKIYSLISNKDRLYSASSDGTINIWSSKTLEHIATLNGHTAGVNSIKLFGDYLYSASSDKSIKIWDISSLKCLHTIFENSSEVLDLTIGSNMLFSSGYDSNITAYNLNDYTRVGSMVGHKWEVWQLEYSNNVLFSGSHDHSLKIWDLRNFENTSTLIGHKGYIHALIWAEGGLLSASLDRQIKFWQ